MLLSKKQLSLRLKRKTTLYFAIICNFPSIVQFLSLLSNKSHAIHKYQDFDDEIDLNVVRKFC